MCFFLQFLPIFLRRVFWGDPRYVTSPILCPVLQPSGRGGCATKFLAVFIHEMSHAAACWVSCGKVHEIKARAPWGTSALFAWAPPASFFAHELASIWQVKAQFAEMGSAACVMGFLQYGNPPGISVRSMCGKGWETQMPLRYCTPHCWSATNGHPCTPLPKHVFVS